MPRDATGKFASTKVADNRLIIRLTPDEAQVLINLIDRAVRASGLEAAESAAMLARRIQEAVPPQPA